MLVEATLLLSSIAGVLGHAVVETPAPREVSSHSPVQEAAIKIN